MSDFLSRLVDRTTGKPATIRPRLAPVYPQKWASEFAARDDTQQFEPTANRSSLQAPIENPREQVPVEPETVDRGPARTKPHMAAESLRNDIPNNRPGPPHSEIPRSGEVEHAGRHDDRAVPSADFEPPASQSFIYRPLVPVSVDAKTAAAESPVIPRFQARPSFRISDRHSGSQASGSKPIGPRATAQPDITVTIGRLDVRAIAPPAPVTAPPPRRSPTLTLDDYLKQRNQGVR